MVNFDFTKISKSAPGTIITKPTVHICKSGEISFYCLTVWAETNYRVAIDGTLVGIEFSAERFTNSFSVHERQNAFRGQNKTMLKVVDLEKYIGTDFHSANFLIEHLEDNTYYFDLTKPVAKYKKTK